MPRSASSSASSFTRHSFGIAHETSRVLAALGAVALLAPGTTEAQTFTKILRGLDRATRADTVATSARPASGGAVRLVEARIEEVDTVSRRFALDSGVTRSPAAAPCGPARMCAAGWDLRVLSVRLPGSEVPAGSRVVVTTMIENRGRSSAPASELAICFARGSSVDGCAGQRGEYALGTAQVPALAPGERAEVRQPVQLTVGDQETSGWAVAAELDPERATDARNRANDTGRSTPTVSRLPSFVMDTLDLPSGARAGLPLPVTLRVRNASPVAASRPTELQFRGSYTCTPGARWVSWGEGPNRVAVPTLGPGQALVLRVLLPDATQCATGNATLEVAPDPANRLAWAGGHERSASRTYVVR